MTVFQVIIYYLATMNLLGFLFMGLDKWKAKKRAWRIPEATLLLIAGLGGAVGSMIGMHLFRHKTRHWYFLYGMPVILALQIILILAVVFSPIELNFW